MHPEVLERANVYNTLCLLTRMILPLMDWAEDTEQDKEVLDITPNTVLLVFLYQAQGTLLDISRVNFRLLTIPASKAKRGILISRN